MEQLILHLIGDYIIQTDYQAVNKTKNIKIAIIHSLTYCLPFLLLTNSVYALSIMFITHVFIDRYRLAKYVVFFKNKLNSPELLWEDCKATGFHYSRPEYLRIWLLIIVDNTLHLIINFLALKYL